MKKILLFICLNIYFVNYCAEADYLWHDEVIINGEIYLNQGPTNDQDAQESIMESRRICSLTLEALNPTEEERVKLIELDNFLKFIEKDTDIEQLFGFLRERFSDIKLLKFLPPFQRLTEAIAKALRFKNQDGVYREISQTLFFSPSRIYEKHQKSLEREHFLKKNCGCCYKVAAFFNAVKAKAKSFF